MKTRHAIDPGTDLGGETCDIPTFLKLQAELAAANADAARADGPTPGSGEINAVPLPGSPETATANRERVARGHVRGVTNWDGPEVVDRLYQAPGAWVGSRDDIVDHDTGNRRRRLRELLAETVILGVVENKRTRRNDFEGFTPQDVLVLIPRPIYERFIDMNAIPLAHMCDRFQEVIQRDFGARFLDPRRGANVAVHPADLPGDEAVFLCGKSVFVANERDRRIYDVAISVTTARGTLRPREGFHTLAVKPVPGQRYCTSEAVPSGIYDGQSSFLMGTDDTLVPNVIPEGLGIPKGATMLVSVSPDRARGDGEILAREGRHEALADGTKIYRYGLAQPARTPGQKLSITVTLTPVGRREEACPTPGAAGRAAGRADDAWSGEADGERGSTGASRRWWWPFGRNPEPRRPRAASIGGERREIGPAEPVAFPPLAHPQTGGETVVISPVMPPPSARPSPYRLSVVGIALPRLPALGPSSWSLGVTRNGDLTVRPPAMMPGAHKTLALLGGHAGDPKLYAIPAGRDDWEAVDPAAIPTLHRDARSGELSPIATPLRTHYHMLLSLAEPRHFPLLAGGPQLIGRHSDAAPNPRANLPKVQFGMLDLPGSVDGGARGRLELVNLSRDHVQAEVIDDRLRVRPHSGQTSVWHLDPARQVVGELRPGTSDTLDIASGEHLLIGCYLTRFEMF